MQLSKYYKVTSGLCFFRSLNLEFTSAQNYTIARKSTVFQEGTENIYSSSSECSSEYTSNERSYKISILQLLLLQPVLLLLMLLLLLVQKYHYRYGSHLIFFIEFILPDMDYVKLATGHCVSGTQKCLINK